jgi:uncharacterized RDD family membrane protein YckC
MGVADKRGEPLAAPSAGFARRAFALAYEALLLFALFLVSALPVVILAHGADRIAARPLFQVYLLGVAAAYFIWQWRHGGQTLAMKTWRIRIVTHEGTPLTLRHALIRFLFGLASTLLAGTGFLWALVDREGLFLHDRLAGKRITSC